ncbi:MAG: hypothetical protein R2857_08115 [Vampirovibrionales bacterium]
MNITAITTPLGKPFQPHQLSQPAFGRVVLQRLVPECTPDTDPFSGLVGTQSGAYGGEELKRVDYGDGEKLQQRLLPDIIDAQRYPFLHWAADQHTVGCNGHNRLDLNVVVGNATPIKQAAGTVLMMATAQTPRPGSISSVELWEKNPALDKSVTVTRPPAFNLLWLIPIGKKQGTAWQEAVLKAADTLARSVIRSHPALKSRYLEDTTGIKTPA